jgi:hypothetical protein
LETKCRNYQPKKAATFSRNHVCMLLLEAADQEWILQQVALMINIFDGCRDELFKMMINDAEDNFEVVNPTTLVVKIPITRTGVIRS